MENYSIREIIEQAVQTERLGYEFYTLQSKKFDDREELLKLFELLAGQELKHEKTFSELKEKLTEEQLENWEEVAKYLRAIVESEFFLGKNKSPPSLHHIKTVEDVIYYAIGFEKETLLYYNALRDSVREKEIIDEIIKEERSHIVWLNDYRKSLRE
jgi:rubrerythrin